MFLVKEFSGFGLLFSFHCSVCFCRFLLPATTSISYHKQLSLSRTFWKTFVFFFRVFSGGLWLNTGIPSKIKVFPVCCSQRRVIIYHITSMVVNTFFQLFSHWNIQRKNVKHIWYINGDGGIWTLAPLLTTYSLSRGAPSASWVHLQNTVAFFRQKK